MTRTEFWQGNIASAEGALAAGCRFFGGYPITPSTEIAEHMADRDTVMETARKLFNTTIKGVPVQRILVEERLDIQHEYFVSITIDRAKKQPVILFAETGGVDIEQTAKSSKSAIRSVSFCPILPDVPGFLLRELCGNAPADIQKAVNRLYHVFCKKDALLAEINPLVTTPDGVYAADAKLIVDDNSLARQGIAINRDLSEREREAEKHGFSFVELDGSIGVIGNGAGLTMSTLDLIEYYGGKAADFLDVGGGADSERVMLTDISINQTNPPGKGARFEIRIPPGKFRPAQGSQAVK